MQQAHAHCPHGPGGCRAAAAQLGSRTPSPPRKGPRSQFGFVVPACGFLEQSASASGDFLRAGAVGARRSRRVPALSPRGRRPGRGVGGGSPRALITPVPGPPRAAGEGGAAAHACPRSAQRTVSASGLGGKHRGAWGKPGEGERTGLPLAGSDALRSCDAAAGERGLRLMLFSYGFLAGVVLGRSLRMDGHELKAPGVTREG